MVRDGVTGALVAPGDPPALAEALAKVLAGDRAGLGAAARAHALAHNELDVVADSWQRLFGEVCGRGGGAAGPAGPGATADPVGAAKDGPDGGRG